MAWLTVHRAVLLLTLLVGLTASAYFISTLPLTPRTEGEGWVSPLGIKPLGDDAREYLALAASIRDNQAFAVQEEPTRMRMPLYPLFIAVSQSLFGSSVRTVQWLQGLLTAGSIGLLYLIGRHLNRPSAALAAAFLLSVFTPFTIRSALIMSEALFVFLLLAALYALLESLRTGRRSMFVTSGLLWGLASLTRTVALPLPVLLVPVAIYAYRERAERRRLLRSLGLMVGVLILVLTPWTIRNAITLGSPTPLPTQGGNALWAASHPDWEAFVDKHMAYAWELPAFLALLEGNHPSEPGTDDRLTSAALDNIRSDPGGWLARNTAKLIRVGYESFSQELADAAKVRDLTDGGGGWRWLVSTGTLLAIALSALGVVVVRGQPAAIVLVVTVGYFYLAHFPSFAEARYFLPVVPLYALFLAVGGLTAFRGLRWWLAEAAKEERAREAERERRRGSG